MFPSRTRVKDFIIKYEESHRLLKSEFLRPVFELLEVCSCLPEKQTNSDFSCPYKIHIILEKRRSTKTFSIRVSKNGVDKNSNFDI